MFLDSSFLDYPDNESEAVIVYFTGCSHGCPGCQNKNLQKYDKRVKKLDIFDIIIQCNRVGTNKIVFSGGDPLYKENLKTTKMLLDGLKDSYDICIYTGFTVDKVKEMGIKGFKFLKCGKYDATTARKSSKTSKSMTFASPNQKLYDSNFKLLSKEGKYIFR